MQSLRTRLVLRVVALGAVLALAATPAAHAQTTTTAPDPYPGTPTTVEPAPTNDERDLGAVEVSGSINVRICNYAANSSVSQDITSSAGLNADIVPDIVADASGCFTDRVEVLPNLVALGGSPLRPLAATGLAQSATKVQVKVNGQTFTVGPYGTVVKVTAVGTGSNGQPRTASFQFTVARRGTVTRSGIVRTGTTIVKFAPLGLGLLGMGYLLVLATRRRRAAEI